ncbi:MAG: phosphate--AMP phosphotransferase, partial [Elusimicrobiota bacterium]
MPTEEASDKLDKKKYQAEMEPLLLKLQRLGRQVYEAKLPVLLVFEGWEGAGKGSVINHLLSRLDPRGTRVYPFFEPNEEEAMRPYFWRFWRCLPGKGQIAVFEQAWYKQLLRRRAEKGLKKKGFYEALDGVNSFERLLAEDGTLIVKFWLDIGKGEQKRVFKEWRRDKDYAFRLTEEAKLQHKHYGRWAEAAGEALQRTNTPVSSWTVVPSEDRRRRRLEVTRAVCGALERALKEEASKRKGAGKTPPAAGEAAAAGRRVTSGPNPLDALRLRRVLKPEEYDSRLGELEERLRQLQHRCYLKRIPVLILFEGMDAAGKGGAIRRLVKPLDPRGYTV